MPEVRGSNRRSMTGRMVAALRRRLLDALFGPAGAAVLADANAIDGLRPSAASVTAGMDSQNQVPSIQPLLEWIPGAEEHLRGLQDAYERLAEVQRRHTMQLDRLTARVAALDGRIADGERLATEIVRAAARARLDQQP